MGREKKTRKMRKLENVARVGRVREERGAKGQSKLWVVGCVIDGNWFVKGGWMTTRRRGICCYLFAACVKVYYSTEAPAEVLLMASSWCRGHCWAARVDNRPTERASSRQQAVTCVSSSRQKAMPGGLQLPLRCHAVVRAWSSRHSSVWYAVVCTYACVYVLVFVVCGTLC